MAVPEEIANIRRMKAKKEVKKRACSHELLQLMEWSIFITTIDDDKRNDAIELLLRYCTFDRRKRKCFNEVFGLIVF